MDTYGDGSDGVLNAVSGPYYLSLDHKYQFSSVYVASSAWLTTTDTTGSVLYITCAGDFVLDGSINLGGIVNRGDNTWEVTIDDTQFLSPGVTTGGKGGSDGYGATGGATANGYGGGGAGVGTLRTSTSNTPEPGGNGGVGGPNPIGGDDVYITRNTNGLSDSPGLPGISGGGGSGSASLYLDLELGSSISARSGEGGSNSFSGFGHGQNGVNGSGGDNTHGGGAWGWAAGGGGGSGGYAGRPGVQVVIKARNLVINESGAIYTYGSDGGKGGNGGQSKYQSGDLTIYGGGGGGGGGGNGGNIYLTYDTTLTIDGEVFQDGGEGGLAGSGGYSAQAGSTGVSGSIFYETIMGIESGGLIVSGATMEFESAELAIDSGGGANNTGGRAIYTTTFQQIAQKEYEFRISLKDGTYLGVWPDIAESQDFGYTQRINENASEMTIRLTRSPDNRVVKLDTLLDQDSTPILDQNSDPILVATETPNSVGEGTDVFENHNVDVYAFYGGYEQLLDHNSEPVLDENGEDILVQFGAPNGKRVYSGWIADYELVYGEETGVDVIIFPHATEQKNTVFKDGETATIEYLNTDPVQMARDAMDSYIDQGGVITYSATSMPLSGESEDYDFKLQNVRQSIDKTVELLPFGYYHFVHPGENIQYLLDKGETADHIFYNGKHLKNLRLRKSIAQLYNDGYFLGGDTGSGDLFKHRTDSGSISTYRRGLFIESDSRVSLDSTATTILDSKIAEFREPRYRTQVIIIDTEYDIESIRLGQNVGFANFGTIVDSLILQIVAVSRRRHSVTLDLDMTIPNDAKRLDILKRQLLSQEVRNIGDTPT